LGRNGGKKGGGGKRARPLQLRKKKKKGKQHANNLDTRGLKRGEGLPLPNLRKRGESQTFVGKRERRRRILKKGHAKF